MSKTPGGTIHEPTHYEALGVAEDAATEEIRAAWRTLIRDIHPDRVSDQESKERLNEQAARINAAYTTLKDPASRRRYDDQLERERAGTESDAESGSDPDAEWDQHEEDYTGTGQHYGTHYGKQSEEYQEYEDEPDWDRMQAEAEAEAAEAWERWENPTFGDRLRQGIYEVSHLEVPGWSISGPLDDYHETKAELSREPSGDGAPTLTLPGFSAFMSRVSIGGLLYLLSTLPGGGKFFIAIPVALFLDYMLCVAGARPIRYVAHKAGYGEPLTDGQNLFSVVTFAVRSIWLGIIQFWAVALLFVLPLWLVSLFFSTPTGGTTLGMALVFIPIVWTVIFLAVWIAKIANGGEPAVTGQGDEN